MKGLRFSLREGLEKRVEVVPSHSDDGIKISGVVWRELQEDRFHLYRKGALNMEGMNFPWGK